MYCEPRPVVGTFQAHLCVFSTEGVNGAERPWQKEGSRGSRRREMVRAGGWAVGDEEV